MPKFGFKVNISVLRSTFWISKVKILGIRSQFWVDRSISFDADVCITAGKSFNLNGLN